MKIYSKLWYNILKVAAYAAKAHTRITKIKDLVAAYAAKAHTRITKIKDLVAAYAEKAHTRYTNNKVF